MRKIVDPFKEKLMKNKWIVIINNPESSLKLQFLRLNRNKELLQ